MGPGAVHLFNMPMQKPHDRGIMVTLLALLGSTRCAPSATLAGTDHPLSLNRPIKDRFTAGREGRSLFIYPSSDWLSMCCVMPLGTVVTALPNLYH